jgi:Na+/H+-dicarboxylate symporter
MKKWMGLFVILAMITGVAAGYATNLYVSGEDQKSLITFYDMLTKIFITLIKMIIGPLVLLTLVAGIGHMGDAAQVGRVGLKAMFWFILMSLISLGIGIVMVEWLQPGVGLNLTPPEGIVAPSTAGFTLEKFILHLFPSSIFKALAENEILQIVVFSLFAGIAVTMLDDKAPEIMTLAEQGANIMLKITEIVMGFAPFAIFGALASTVAKSGVEVLFTYAKFMGGFYASLGILWAFLTAMGFLFLGGKMLKIFGVIREPLILAFSTASSEAAYPKLMSGLPQAGVSRKITSFVLPLGYSFNLDGSMMYTTFATLFIAQAHGIQFSLQEKILLLLILMVTSKGIAGVPRASLVVIMAALTYFGLPAEWIAIVLGVDHLLDMGRSATNVLGNSVAAGVVDRWEGSPKDEKPITLT